MEPHETAHLSLEEKKALFRDATITHRQLEVVHRRFGARFVNQRALPFSWFMARLALGRPG
jgi:hypothetical protein